MTQRNLFLGGGLLALLLLLVAVAVVRVPEDRQAIILQLGRPVATVNTYQPNQIFGKPGLAWCLKTPFVQNTVFIDKRIMSLDIPPQTVLSTDQLRLVVDAYARFRVTNPGEDVPDGAHGRTACGRAFADPFVADPERAWRAAVRPSAVAGAGRSMENIQEAVNRSANAYGAEIIDVRIKRADLPPGHAAGSRLRADADGTAAGSAHHPCTRRKECADHPRRSRCTGGPGLCRKLREGPAVLLLLSRNAGLSDQLQPGQQLCRAEPEQRVPAGIPGTPMNSEPAE
jgi:hypothetical protein